MQVMDVALPHELNTEEAGSTVRGFGLELRDTYGAALYEPAPSEYEGRPSQCPRTYFHDDRAVDEEGNFLKAKIRALGDRRFWPAEVERIRETWELRCNRALRKAGM